MFCELADSYVQSINSDSIPSISTAWDRVMDGELRRVYDNTIKEVESVFKNIITKKFPLEEVDLRE